MSRDNDSRGSTGPARRSVLKAVGASAIAGVAVAGNASADDGPITDLDEFEAEFADANRVRWAVTRHADALLAGLAERNLLTDSTGAEFFDAADVTTTPIEIDGVTSGRITVSKEFESHSVELVVFPERERRFAYVHRDAQTRKLRVEDGDVAVETACDCYYEYKCEGLCPDGTAGYPHQRYSRECCDCDNGTVCDDWSADSGVCCA